MGKINVLKVEPMKVPSMIEIDDGLASMQKQVGGYIEVVYPYKDLVGIICNEEGKINGLPLNRAIYDDNGEMVDIIAGTFLVAGLGDEDFTSLNSEYAAKYGELFHCPEEIMCVAGQIIVEKLEVMDIPKQGMMAVDEIEAER